MYTVVWYFLLVGYDKTNHSQHWGISRVTPNLPIMPIEPLEYKLNDPRDAAPSSSGLTEGTSLSPLVERRLSAAFSVPS